MEEFIKHAVEPGVYGGQALAAIYGVFCTILIYRKIRQKKFSSPAQGAAFLDEVRSRLTKRDFDGVAELCDSPPYWSKAVSQLILVALAHRDRSVARIRQLLGEKYERDVLAELDYRTVWIQTIVKIAPMLGLLGTASGMIAAFGKLATAKGGVDPLELAENISIALFATAFGLAIAVSMTVLGSAVHVRKGKLTDSVQEHISEFLYDLEKVMRQ